jgi:hypothetical protein
VELSGQQARPSALRSYLVSLFELRMEDGGLDKFAMLLEVKRVIVLALILFLLLGCFIQGRDRRLIAVLGIGAKRNVHRFSN